jgi:peptidoglycan/xylan/chitin deacetylase (PgdA/CDA1 family)
MIKVEPEREQGVLKSTSKRWLKKALVRSSILGLAGQLARPSAAILMYHSVVEDPRSTENTLGISRDRASFEAHMKIMATQFNPVTIDDVARFAKSGHELPRQAVVVTFDDGFADNYEVALPILNRYGIPATFYIMVDAVANGVLPWYCRLRFAFNTTKNREWQHLKGERTYPLTSPEERRTALTAAWESGARTTGSVQQEFVSGVEESLDVEPASLEHGLMLDWDQVRSLRKAGHTVGAHTLSHPNVAQISQSEARSEILGSKKKLEAELGEPIGHFSYPHPALNPQWSEQTLQITREAGFDSAVLTTRGPVRAGDESLALKRINTPADLEQFAFNLQCTFLGRSV